MLVEECHRVAPWVFPTQRTAQHLMVEAVLSTEFGRGAHTFQSALRQSWLALG